MRLDWISAGRAWPRARPWTFLFKADTSSLLPFAHSYSQCAGGCRPRSQLLAAAEHPHRAQSLSNTRLFASSSRRPYDFRRLEASWTRKREAAIPQPRSALRTAGKATYILPMFPYPSGNLHLGHLRVYTISDVITRFIAMQGLEVIQPMGWDAFGLPAENAAIERGVKPSEWTTSNIERMRTQLTAMGGRWNWEREVVTCDPKFYKHTQALFLLLHKHGLAYQKEALVNFDPVDQTVLANEQVDSEGRSWRSGAIVEKKMLKQWFLRISAFQDELLADLNHLSADQKWPESVIAQQEHWLGKSQGARIGFPLGMTSNGSSSCREIEVFTTRPDTILGVQFLAISVVHPLAVEAAQQSTEVRSFIDRVASLPEGSKEGFLLPKTTAINPLTAADDFDSSLKQSLPIYITSYVIPGYGSDAVMGVPGHDVRDWEFLKENRPTEAVRQVLSLASSEVRLSKPEKPFLTEGYLSSECGPFAGLTSKEATPKIIQAIQEAGLHAETAITWRLRDWLVSRQRYWGTPIPMIHCSECGWVPVPNKDLPVELPVLEENDFQSAQGNPLASAYHWLNTQCPKCNGPATRETDTMDTFVDSSWYQLRFADPSNQSGLFSPDAAEKYLPVDIYLGGVEHAILHLLYARFITKFLSSPQVGLVRPNSPLALAHGEPFSRLITQGMVHGLTYRHPTTDRPLDPVRDVSIDRRTGIATLAGTNTRVKATYEKMSKSKHNGVDPCAAIDRYGLDAVRTHILFLAPVSDVLEWDESNITGAQRWIARVLRLVDQLRPAAKISPSKSSSPLLQSTASPQVLSHSSYELLKQVNEAIKLITDDYRAARLNIVVARLMTLTKQIIRAAGGNTSTEKDASMSTAKSVNEFLVRYATVQLVRLMNPITPVISRECFARLHMPAANDTQLESAVSDPNQEAKTATAAERGRIGEEVESQWPEVLDLGDESQNQGAHAQTRSTNNPEKTIKCAVQINGTLRFVTNVRIPPSELTTANATTETTETSELGQWFSESIWRGEAGKGWLEKKSADLVVDKVIVVKGGRVVNFVIKSGG